MLVLGVTTAIDVLRNGIQGPADVSNAPAVVLEIIIFFAIGAGLLVVARGWQLARRWARAPFLLANLIGVAVGWGLAGAAGAERFAGMAAIAAGVVGIVLAFLPATSRALATE